MSDNTVVDNTVSDKAIPKNKLPSRSKGKRINVNKPLFEPFKAEKTTFKLGHLSRREFDASFIGFGSEFNNRFRPLVDEGTGKGKNSLKRVKKRAIPIDLFGIKPRKDSKGQQKEK